ncbi:putative succinate fumarate mitochondrial transporter protein [Neofusicoccum parvum UCRNP2]|uniref:Putative succinate fumarate mitochondrial transporter protein n=1 Tax=Botryosphaeria parva (strain UCR-NP2) TaxID=1287680 RepID=R1GHB7_BOTPV|nr:putative succinate fumarate mitochondrial transporter protein [Neofusicoccum parvum UCRNP2]
MAVRFASFEAYKSSFQTVYGDTNGAAVFSAGLAAGITEAVFVVNPMEVVKIRLQGQKVAPAIGGVAGMPEYRNALHAAGSVAWREGIGALYQAAIGLISGAIGPMCNAPIDTIKTRMQNSAKAPGESGLRKGIIIVVDMLRNEGVRQAVTFTVYEFMKRQLQG